MINMVSSSNVTNAFHTSLCKLLNIRYPILQAGMSGFTTPELVAAVSNAGGLGILGASRIMPEQLGDTIRKIKRLTTNPFGVNLLLAPAEKEGNQDIEQVQQFLDNRFRQELKIPPKANQNISIPPSRLSEQLKIILEEKVPVVSFAMGNPSAKLVEQIHSSSSYDGINAKVISMITTVEEAANVVRNGTDIVVAQGAEAGGHRSTFNIVNDDKDLPLIGTMTLVPQVVDALKTIQQQEEEKKEEGRQNNDNHIPVIAAGGIADGRGLIAALALGADGIMIGTRFLVARESGAFQAYQDRLLAATECGTIITRAFTGRPARGLRNHFLEEYHKSGPQPLAWPRQALAADDIYTTAQKQNNADYFPLLAGQGIGLLKGEKQQRKAEEIIQELVVEANEALSKLK
jgi:nitronate monooxygenase